jgi:periplasmic copper chaperone A
MTSSTTGVRRRGARAVGLALLGPATSASAHVSIDPAAASAGQLVQLTFTVPNEKPDQAITGLDVTLPQGFLLESAQQVPGWTTAVDTAPNKIPTAVHWSGGRSGPSTFVTFAIRGRMPSGGGVVTFPAVQRYERSTVSWSKPDQSSDLPAPVVTLQADVKGLNGSALPTVPPAGTVPTAGTAAGSSGSSGSSGVIGADSLARSRSSLALALSFGALLLALGALGAAVLTRRPAGVAPAAVAAPAPVDRQGPAPGQPVKALTKRKR